MVPTPLFTLNAAYAGPAAGADAAGASGALLANPYVDAAAAIAAAAAYGFSPSVRKTVNPWIKKGYEGITNPFQHFGDGSPKDKFGNFLNGRTGELDPTGGAGFLRGMTTNDMPGNNPTGFMQNLLGQAKDPNQQQRQNQNQNGGNTFMNTEPIPPHAIPIAELPRWTPNPNAAYVPSPPLPQRMYY